MKKLLQVGVAVKIFGGFMALVVLALATGGVGNLSLHRVIGHASDEELATRLQTLLLEARRQEKNYLLRSDQESFANLTKTLDQIQATLDQLKERGLTGEQLEKLVEAQEDYRLAALEIKRLTEEDAKLLGELQAASQAMAQLSAQESERVAQATRDKLVANLKETLDKATLRQVADAVGLACDALAWMESAGHPKSAALGLIRALRFAGNNHFYVVGRNLTLLAHGGERQLEGMDCGVIKDQKTGRPFIKELVEAAVADGEAEIEHHWTKPGGGSALYPMITYARHYASWDLVVCAGVYLDDLALKTAYFAEMLSFGLGELRAAHDLDALGLRARVAALYYLKYGQQAEEVGQHLKAMRAMEMAPEDLRQQAQVYEAAFAKQVSNAKLAKEQVTRIQRQARRFMTSVSQLSLAAQQEFSATAQTGRWLLLVVVGAAAVVGLVLAWLVTRAIARPVRKAIAGLRGAAEQVAASSQEVGAASQSLAEGASQQAASLEQTSASLEQMASMSRANAENASQANQLMEQTRQVAGQANASMKDLRQAMQQISQASDQTAKIIKTIDEIAFQTNLLALNAAVEAARAGEAGAGFAVVAGEVRALAQRAAEAARNTAQLIEQNLQNIKAGNQLVAATDQVFEQVNASAAKVAELLGEITAASQEQAQGVNQLNQALSQMDRVTQQNAAYAEQTSASSQEMMNQAELMRGHVRDLITLVEGAWGRDGAPAGAKRLAPPTAAGTLAPLAGAAATAATGAEIRNDDHAALGLEPTAGLATEVAKEPALELEPSPPLPGPQGGSRPAEVIPFDDEAEFKDF
ncbi:MAG: methyl-accepting chemotaxis protein [Desulfarculus sp.]|nr:methyl-accepting chemotaxis protein [Desulfarculus sp.]